MAITPRVVRRARKHYGVDILWHKQWGSRARDIYALRRRLRTVRVMKADTLVQHITVTNPTGDFKADMQTVERIGVERFGSGFSYNFGVDMTTGQIGVGQPLDAKGTHTVNDKGVRGFSRDQNHAARAIAVIGQPHTPLSDKAKRAIAGLIAAMMDEGAITEDPDYLPHSFFAWKDCPSDPTRNAMPEIFALAKELRKSGGKTPRPVVLKPTNISLARKLLVKALKANKPGPRRQRIVRALDDLPQR